MRLCWLLKPVKSMLRSSMTVTVPLMSENDVKFVCVPPTPPGADHELARPCAGVPPDVVPLIVNGPWTAETSAPKSELASAARRNTRQFPLSVRGRVLVVMNVEKCAVGNVTVPGAPVKSYGFATASMAPVVSLRT
jgi:hypothetical protein